MISNGGKVHMTLKTFVLLTVAALAATADASTKALESAVKARVLPFGPAQVSSSLFAAHEIDELDVAADRKWREIGSRKEYDAYRLELRRRMLDAIGTMPEKTPLNARTVATYRRDGYRVEKVIFESMPGIFVTANLFIPDGAVKRPAVVMSCGHSDSGKDAPIYLRACVIAVKKGFVTLMFDPYAQGERIHYPIINSCRNHNQMGLRGSLIDWSAPLLRIWDGIRAIDYVSTRTEVDPERIGYMGQSGGGTMTALMETVEPRIKAAAPSCYLTSLSELCHWMGPQDGEQNIFGQLAFGLNHTGYVLIPDIPVAVTCKFSDMFPFYGTRTLFDTVEEVERKIGKAGRAFLNSAPGPHGWTEATEVASVDFLARHLLDEFKGREVELTKTRLCDFGFDLGSADVALSKEERGCTEKYSTKDLPGSRDIYQVINERAREAKKNRRKLSPAELSAEARIHAAIPGREAGMLAFKEWDAGEIEALKVKRVVGQYRNGAMLPMVLIESAKVKPGAKPVLVTAHAGRARALKLARVYIDIGRPVLIADVTGVGEVGQHMYVFYAAKERPDEGLGVMQYLMGKPLVGRRALDMLLISDYLAGRYGARPTLVASGFLAVPAAHAWAADLAAWDGIELVEKPLSWEEQLASVPPELMYYADLVPRAYLKYDWTELLSLGKK